MNYNDPLIILLNLFEFVLFYTAMNNMLTRKGSFLALVGTIAAVLPVYYIGSYFLQSVALIKIFYGVLLIFIPIAIFYSDHIIKRIALYAGCWIILIITEVIIGLVFGADMPESHPVIVYGSYLAIQGMLLLIYVFTVNSFGRKYKNLLRPVDRLAMALFLFCQFFMFYGLMRFVRTDIFFNGEVDTPVGMLILCVVLCVMSDALLFWMLIRSARATRTEAENAVLTRQVEDQKKYYSSLSTQYETIRHMRHDIANHIYTVKALLSDRKIEEAEEYAGKLSEEHEKLSLSRFCDDPVVDSFLNSRVEELKEKGIEVRVNTSIPRAVGIDGTELITALGNLLDNAEEACHAQEKPEIGLTAGISENVLMLRTENPVSAQKEHRERIPGLSRGIGTVILRELAGKYDGHYELENSADRCTASLYLRLPM